MIFFMFLACGASEKSEVSFADEASMFDTAMSASDGNWEEDYLNEEAGVEYQRFPEWWRLFADIQVSALMIDQESSMVKVVVYDEFIEPICTQNYSIVESQNTTPSFSEGLLWWELKIAEADSVSMDDDMGEEEVEERNQLPSTSEQECTFDVGIVDKFQLGVGQFHVESQAVWDSIDWLDIAAFQDPDEATNLYSAYVSFDEGETVWVYGIAVSNLIGTDDSLSESEMISMDQVWYLRPAYVFPL